MDLDEAMDAILCNMRSGTPKMCGLKEFYLGIFPPEQEKQRPKLTADVNMNMNPGKGNKVLVGGIRSAEQFRALEHMGLVRREPK